MQGPVVLPEDVQIVPLTELPTSIRTQLEGLDGDFALTRPLSRTPSKVIDSNAAALLQQFRDPKTIVEAILAYSKQARVRPTEVLEEAYPLIESCILARLLVEPGTDSEKIQPSFGPGDLVGDNVVERPVQALIDSEVYQVKTRTGGLAALKIARQNAIPAMQKMLAREAEMLERIGGLPAPMLLGMSELQDGRPYLLVEWFDGDNVQSAVQKLNETDGSESARRVAELCSNIVDAYATLHERGVVHADVHPRNVLVSEAGEVRIIDFGIACGVEPESHLSPRAGVAFFFEPEYAQAMRHGSGDVRPTVIGEQYGVASLVYFLLCGKYYLDFSFDKGELLRQIVEEKPLTFERQGAIRYKTLEPAVMRALRKEPSLRFDTTRQFARACRDSLVNDETPRPYVPHTNDDEGKLLERVLSIIADPQHKLDYLGPRSPSASLTYGSAGIAYAAYRISGAREDAGLLALADAWAERSAVEQGETAFYRPEIQITPQTVGRVSPYHTASGLALVQALVANARGDRFHLDTAGGRFLQSSTAPCSNPDLTLGRASVLHGLTLLLESCGPAKPQGVVERGDGLCAGVQELVEREPAIGDGGAISYLGIAHGWAGLLYAILRWGQLMDKKPDDAVEVRLRQLAERVHFTRRGARWPVQTLKGSIALAGWCNGSAGYTHLWTLAHRIYGDSLYLDLAEKSAMDAFEGVGGGHALCCGYAGQAYAQLCLYKHTRNQLWLEHARVLTRKAAVGGNAALSHHEDGLPHSLYKGDVGVAVLVAEIEKPELASMPFFESEP